MFERIPFKKEHLEPLMLQKINAYLPEWVRNGHALDMEKTYAFTGIVKGEIMICGGITEVWAGRGHLWSIFSDRAGANFLPVFRGIKRFLEEAPFARVEMSVPCDFFLGKRRAELLGFNLECARAKHYLPNGQDCSLYARIKQVGLS